MHVQMHDKNVTRCRSHENSSRLQTSDIFVMNLCVHDKMSCICTCMTATRSCLQCLHHAKLLKNKEMKNNETSKECFSLYILVKKDNVKQFFWPTMSRDIVLDLLLPRAFASTESLSVSGNNNSKRRAAKESRK